MTPLSEGSGIYDPPPILASRISFQLFHPLKIGKESMTPHIRGGLDSMTPFIRGGMETMNPPIGGGVESMTTPSLISSPPPRW